MQQCHWKACHCHHVTVKCSVLDVSFSMLQEMAASRMLSRNSGVTDALSTLDEQPDRKLQPGLAFCGWTSFKLLLKPGVWGPALLLQALLTTESPNSLLVSRTLPLTCATGGKATGKCGAVYTFKDMDLYLGTSSRCCEVVTQDKRRKIFFLQLGKKMEALWTQLYNIHLVLWHSIPND